MKEKNTEYMPNQYWHRQISFVKSFLRIGGYFLLPFSITYAVIVLVLSEVLGIAEELVG